MCDTSKINILHTETVITALNGASGEIRKLNRFVIIIPYLDHKILNINFLNIIC